MDAKLIEKYNIPVPRYTSYPPANYFEAFSNEHYLQFVDESNTAINNAISFYLHIPFCRHLCHYCGCNSYHLASPQQLSDYVKALHQEIDIIIARLDKNRRVSQIHYGGGSPTFLPASIIKELNEHLLGSFKTIDNPEIAIECHPGYLSHKDWEDLTDCGFNRYSIGVQDFNEKVLKTVNRTPSLLNMAEIFAILRSKNAHINMDFLYGLPFQTADTFKQSIAEAITLKPDRLVTFGYAHVPWVSKRQLVLEKYGLPGSEQRSEMFAGASELLHQAGYHSIGIDHFVLPEDELWQAVNNHQLHRNFQGYCTRRTTAQVYAFGVTGISQLDGAYTQNTKDIQQYIDTLQQGNLTIAKGYALSADERITREVIESLMCNNRIDWDDLSSRLHISVENIKSATAYREDVLNDFRNDGLIEYDQHKLIITEQGLPFVRNVAASFDKLMLHSNKAFSKPI